jgi:pyrimidine operon attenuation protein/uracil phosphoribosyltransferase
MDKHKYDAEWIDTTTNRLAEEVISILKPEDKLAVVGIVTRGSAIAERLCKKFKEAGRDFEFGEVDVTLYRDDISGNGGRKAIKASNLEFDLNDKFVVLVDDVFSTGRTTRAALAEIMDYGRPAVIRLVCLLDRGGHELPIRPDLVGENVTAPDDCKICVRMQEIDNIDEVVFKSVDA